MRAIFEIAGRNETRVMIVEINGRPEECRLKAEKVHERLRGMYRRVDLIALDEAPMYTYSEAMEESRLIHVE